MTMTETAAAAPIATDGSLSEWGARLDQAVAAIHELPGESRAAAEAFALALDSLSRTALTEIVRRLRADPRGKELLFELVDDPAVRMLLGMHGIIRLPDPEQAERVRLGLGADGEAANTPAPRAFISLEAMLRGPAQAADACGCGGPAAAADACGCGGH